MNLVKGWGAAIIISGSICAAIARYSLPISDHAQTLTPGRMAARRMSIPLIIEPREIPIGIESNKLWLSAASRQQAFIALEAALPVWDPPPVPNLIHYLQLWGTKSRFVLNSASWTGKEMLDVLVSDPLCRRRTVDYGADYIVDSPFGAHVVQVNSRDSIGLRGEGHYGQLLKALAQAGVPLSTTVTVSSGKSTTLAYLLQDAVMRFDESQELDFIACVLASYMPSIRGWKNQFNSEYSFDELMHLLLARKLGEGACGGCHHLYAIAFILRVDEQCALLSKTCKDDATHLLRRASRRLEQSALPTGGWDRSWPPGSPAKLMTGDSILDRLSITGHHLEWLAIAPSYALAISADRISAAVEAVVHDIVEIQSRKRQIFKSALPITHAARALCLLRSEEPFQLYMAMAKLPIPDEPIASAN